MEEAYGLIGKTLVPGDVRRSYEAEFGVEKYVNEDMVTEGILFLDGIYCHIQENSVPCCNENTTTLKSKYTVT